MFGLLTHHIARFANCQVCQDALKNVNRLTVLSYISAVACLFLALLIDERYISMQDITAPASVSLWNTLPPNGFRLAIAGAIILAIIGYLLKKLSRLFYIYKFSHSNNN